MGPEVHVADAIAGGTDIFNAALNVYVLKLEITNYK